MKVTVADLFDACYRLCRERDRIIVTGDNWEEAVEAKDKLEAIISTIREALRNCRHEIELSPEDYRAVERFFSKTIASV